jgi:hypothetical protein
MPIRRVHVGLAAALFGAPTHAQAQIGLEGLLSGVTDVSIFFTCWQTRGQIAPAGACSNRRNGFGVEISYNVGLLPLWRSPRRPVPEKRDTTMIAVKRGTGGYDTTTTVTITKATTVPVRHFYFELGLGYSQFAGFGSNDPSYELRGTVREVPSISLYGTYRDEKIRLLKYLNPYAGVRSGLLQVSSLSLYDGMPGEDRTTYNASATAFQIGIVGGVQLNVGDRIRAYYEWSNTNRRLPNLQWSSPGTNRVREAFPRELDFSGRGRTVGVQITLRPFKP